MTTKTAPRPVAEESAVLARAAAMLTLAYDQRVTMRADAAELLESLTIGLQRRHEQRWVYDASDMPGATGDGWKRVGKLSLLLAQLDNIRHALDWQATTKPLAPLWCAGCEGTETPGAPYLKWECIDHDASPVSAQSWTQLFGAPS